MRTTTRIALALFVAVVLALTFYAYPSVSGFITIAIRAVAILGVLAVTSILLGTVTKRSLRRLDVIVVLATIGLVAASWTQINARIDAARLDSEIAEAGAANILSVLATTETNAGRLVRESNDLRDEVNAELDLVVAGLWDEDRLAFSGSPDTIDDAEYAQLEDRIALLVEAEERARGTVDAIIDAEVVAISEIDTPLPDSARLVFVGAATQRTDADRAHYHQRLLIAADRLSAIANLVALLRNNLGRFTFDGVEQQIVFDDPAAAATYSSLLASIDNTWLADDVLVSAYQDSEIEKVLTLVEAAGATP